MKVSFCKTFPFILLFSIFFSACSIITPALPSKLLVSYDTLSSQVVLQWESQPFVDRYLIYRGLDIQTNKMHLITSVQENEFRDSYPLSGNIFYSIQSQNFFGNTTYISPVMIYVPPSRSLRFPIFLSTNTWTNACLPSSGITWYELPVEGGQDYNIQWRDQAYLDSYIDILVSIYDSTNAPPVKDLENIDYSPVLYHANQSGSLFLKIHAFSPNDYGRFEIRYNPTTNL